MRFRPHVLPALAALAFAGSAKADVEFESSALSLKPKIGEQPIHAAFKFKNTGAAPVTISSVMSSCGCTVPDKPSEPIAPGATGIIPVVYHPGTRQGPQSQEIVVGTSDGKVHQLKLSVDLPIRISFAPRLLVFSGEERGAKTAVVTFGESEKTELVEVSIQSPAFEIVGAPAIENGALKIPLRHIGPANADARASVRIKTRDSSGAEHTDILYARHRPE